MTGTPSTGSHLHLPNFSPSSCVGPVSFATLFSAIDIRLALALGQVDKACAVSARNHTRDENATPEHVQTDI